MPKPQKSTEVKLYIRIPDSLMKRLKREAESEDRSVANFVTRELEALLDRREVKS